MVRALNDVWQIFTEKLLSRACRTLPVPDAAYHSHRVIVPAGMASVFSTRPWYR
ncbi:MAG TPA: hypothetical protein VMX79_09125 [bacterium]|nr:hypothetical protein [bacterium]